MINIKALLCIHGILSSNIDYEYIKKYLHSYYDFIYTINLPGHGNNTLKFSVTNTLDYVIKEYDILNKKYNEIDVIGYSLGGVLATYIALYRNVNKLILLSPAFNYINIKNYNPKSLNKSSIKISDAFSIKKIKYFYIFTKIVKEVESQINYIYQPICIIWGNDDVLVNNKGCFNLYKRALNINKYYYTLNGINHTSILHSDKVIRIIQNFIE